MTVRQTLEGPSALFQAVVPSDTTNLARPTRYLYVAAGGDVAVHAANDDATPTVVVFRGVLDGTVLPICVRRVLDTGTTAAELVALY
jgi:hypothetical protein